MSDREICAACRGPWPCECSPQAVPVVLMDTADKLAHRMGAGRNDPLTVQPYDPDPPVQDTTGSGNERFCGHRQNRYDLDTDKRVVSCRACGTALDPYDVLHKLVSMLQGVSMRLEMVQQLERREAVRDAKRKARAAVRRHKYASYAYKEEPEHCAACGKGYDDAIHTDAARRTQEPRP